MDYLLYIFKTWFSTLFSWIFDGRLLIWVAYLVWKEFGRMCSYLGFVDFSKGTDFVVSDIIVRSARIALWVASPVLRPQFVTGCIHFLWFRWIVCALIRIAMWIKNNLPWLGGGQ